MHKNEKAQRVITKYCKEKGILDSKQMIIDEIILSELVNKLLKTKLSVRKIAELLEISVTRVQRFKK